MYHEGVEKVEDGLDMVKIIRLNVENTAAVRATVMNLDLHDQISKSEKMVIKLHSDFSMSEHSEAER